MNVTSVFTVDLSRQLTEAVKMNSKDDMGLINDKTKCQHTRMTTIFFFFFWYH